MSTPQNAAAEYLAALEAEKKAKALKDQAAENLKVAYATRGIHTVVTGGRKVSVVPVTRTTVDTEALFDCAPGDLYERVTKIVVDLSAWHKAVDLGLVDPVVIDKVVTVKESARIEVDSL